MVGPIAGANVADTANSARPIGCLALGSSVMMSVNAIGISVPPVKPWTARSTIICDRSCAKAQATDSSRNSTALVRRYLRIENTCASQPLSGITTISAIRYEVEIQPPSSMPAPIAPWMSASDALTIWMLSTAMKAPSVAPPTAIQVFVDTTGSAGAAACLLAKSAEEAALKVGCSVLMAVSFRLSRHSPGAVPRTRPAALLRVRRSPSTWC